jgi:NADH:ubiquinone reductase (H+-translocating)
MKQQIVIAGLGFAGMWSAISAARAVSIAGKEGEVGITVISPTPNVHIRPRLYETAFSEMAPDVSKLLAEVGVKHVKGLVDGFDTKARKVTMTGQDGKSRTLPYDRLIVATGSTLNLPGIPGLKERSFNVDQLADAEALHAHITGLAGKPDTPSRNTIVVGGGGFTGIETAAEMPARLRGILGPDTRIRVVIVEQAAAIGPELGPGPRPVILEALEAMGVEIIVNCGVAAVDAEGVTLSDGRRIATTTFIWTAGMRAHPLAAQLKGDRDDLGRIHADAFLRATGEDGVFVTGDMSRAATDDAGNVASMSCQHALSLGRVSGHNAAAELVGLPLHPYSQQKYVTCLDLGPWGAVYSEGWDRKVHMRGDDAKALKKSINTQWIYPPAADRKAAFDVANPDYVIVP